MSEVFDVTLDESEPGLIGLRKMFSNPFFAFVSIDTDNPGRSVLLEVEQCCRSTSPTADVEYVFELAVIWRYVVFQVIVHSTMLIDA